jgi:hypothetical protein
MNQEFADAFNTHVKGQVVKEYFSAEPYGTPDKPYYGDGVELENGYKYISHGGGCSGEDCNASFIIGPDDKLVATFNW